MIDVGDKVDLYFEHVDCEPELTITHFPQATGDSWMATRPDGTEVYFQVFAKMVKRVGDDVPF